MGLSLALPIGARAAVDGVRVAPAVGSTIRFTVDVPEPHLVLLPGSSGVNDLKIEGYSGIARAGETVMPQRIFVVGVPPDGEISVSANASGARRLDGALLATQPRVPHVATADDPDALLGRLGNLDRRTAVAGAPLVTLLDVSWLRDQRIARIAVSPASFDLASRAASVASQVEVEVRVSGARSLSSPADTTVASGPFEDVYRGLLVNDRQSRAWRAGRRAAVGGGAGVSGGAGLFGAQRAAAAQAVPDSSVYAGRGWVKIAIGHRGLYKVLWSQVRNTAVFRDTPTPALDSLRLFTWPGYPVLPEGNYCDSCDFREVALQVVDNGDGVFSNDADYVYFYALGPSDWGDIYDPSRPDTEFVNNPYETRNYYYLTIADSTRPVGGVPQRIATASGDIGDPTGTVTPSTFSERLHFEQDADYEPNATPVSNLPRIDVSGTRNALFWEKWFWQSITQGTAFTAAAFDLPGFTPGDAARVRLLYWGLTVVDGKSSGIRDHYLDVTVGGQAQPRQSWNDRDPVLLDVTLNTMQPAGNSVVSTVPRITDPNLIFDRNRLDQVGLAWYDVTYARRFEPVNDVISFSSPGGRDAVYDIGPFSGGSGLPPPAVFDVTDPLHPREILNVEWTVTPPTARVRFRQLETGPRRYLLLRDTAYGRPLATDIFDAPSSSYQNLRDPAFKADYLVIYFDGFRAAADELLRWRQQHLALDGVSAPYDTASVPISALYDQFSGGRTDPTAIRNFLRAAYANWGKVPTFVTFLGDGSYDFKNLRGLAAPGAPGSMLPSYEGGFDVLVAAQFATDDWLLNVDNPNVVVPDFLSGRIPAPDPDAAVRYVRDKLIPYESTAPRGLWRDQAMLIGDDDKQASQPDPIGWDHVRYSAQLDRFAIPHDLDRDYVYLHTYPDGPNYTKPGAKAEIVSRINEGVGVVNYVGHGSPFKIADESVFLDTDASAATNATRPTVFCAASCDVGKFNNPLVPSLGERLVLNPGGGAVAVVSATELAFSSQNASLNLTLFQQIYQRSAVSGRYYNPIAAGLLAAKTGSVNSSKYQVMGDAGVRLLLPHQTLVLQLLDADSNAVTSVKRGQVLRVRGDVLDRPGGALVPVNGTADFLVEESAPIDTVPGCTGQFCVTYPWRAASIFRGDAEVQGGHFDFRCVVPVDAVLGPRARVRGYLTGSDGAWDSDGAGQSAFGLAAGSIPTGDVSGPSITLSFPGGSTTVRGDASLRIDLSDPSGILITGNTPQNGVIVTLDENSTLRTDATASFRYATNSYQTGTATYPLGGLAPGPHRLTVSAADNLAGGITAAEHRSSTFIDFVVSDNPTLNVTRAILFPNPTRSGGAGGGGTFVIDVPGDPVNVLLRIYTVSGKLIRSLEFWNGLGQVQIPWDGLDSEGDPLANGTYLFTVHVNPRDADGSSSPSQTARAEGRLVVVRH